MGNYVYASIEFGEVPDEKLEDFRQMLMSSSLTYPGLEEIAKTQESLKEFLDSGPAFEGEAVSFGRFEAIEEYCVENGIAFDRYAGAGGGFDAEIVRFRPDMESPDESVTTDTYSEVVPTIGVAEIRDRLKDGDVETALAGLNRILCSYDIPPLKSQQEDG